MSRHRVFKKYVMRSNFHYDSVLVQKMTNQLIKDGKRARAYTLMNRIIHEIEQKTQKDPVQAIEQAIRNIAPAVEIKARRIGGAIYSIPVELSSSRGVSIAIRWIIKCCENKTNYSFALKIANEIIDASNKIGRAIRKRDDVYKIAESNTKLL